MTVIFGIFLLTLLLITAAAMVHTSNLLVAVLLAGIFSLLLALNFFLLDAADVALTEAAVGAGISTVLFLGALALTAEHERAPTQNRLVSLAVVTITALIVIYATFDKPRFGAPDAPVQTHVGKWYLDNTDKQMGFPNVVTAVLGSYRAYDTLGEVFVVLTAGLGVLFLLGAPPPRPGTRLNLHGQGLGLRHYLVPRVVGRLVIPFIVLFGLYVQFHGEYSPGGGFQAGAIVAAAIILFALLEGEEAALRAVPRSALLVMAAGGATLFTTVGIVTMLMGGNFLDYTVLLDDPVMAQQTGVIVIEAGVGITVTGVLLSIFHAFASRERPA